MTAAHAPAYQVTEMSMCSYCTISNSNHTMRLCRVSDIRTDNYIVVSGSRTTVPFIIQEE